MTTYAFRIRLRDALADDGADRLYEAFDDEIAVEDGPMGHFVGFERSADCFLDAVVDAITEVIALGFEPITVEDELVSMADIAERTGRTRQSVSMIVRGKRGPGGFPRTAAGNVRSPLWHWADVSSWFESAEGSAPPSEDRTLLIASINGVLAKRALSKMQRADLERIERLAG